MEYSSAEMTCVLKVNTQCEACKVKVMKVLRNIRGVYNITIDGEQGTVKVTGRVNPSTLLGVLEKYGRHAEVKFIKFDGEVVERPHSYGDYGYGYDPYYMEGSYPLLGCPQHQWYPTSLSFSPPPPPPPPGPPPPPRPPPPLAPCHVAPPPPPPPVAPCWGPPPRPYGPPPLGPFRPPRPPSQVPRGGTSGQNKNVVTEQNHCAIM